MTDNKERDAFEAWLKERPYANFADYAWEAWQSRAALAASQEKAEPVAYVDGDDSLRRILWEPDQAAFNLPVGTKLYAALAASQEKAEPVAACLSDAVNGGVSVMRIAPSDAVAVPVAAQASEPVAVLRFDRGTPGRENEMPHVVSCNRLPDGDYAVYLTPQPSAEAVRDAAYEKAANKATGFLVGDPLAGIPLRSPTTHEIADAIRALKSAPPQPAEQPGAEGEQE